MGAPLSSNLKGCYINSLDVYSDSLEVRFALSCSLLCIVLCTINPLPAYIYPNKLYSSIRLSNNSTALSLLSSLMLLSAILVLVLILISHSPTTSATSRSPAPASCTYAISTASDPCLTLKLHSPLPPPSSTQN